MWTYDRYTTAEQITAKVFEDKVGITIKKAEFVRGDDIDAIIVQDGKEQHYYLHSPRSWSKPWDAEVERI